jgi:cytoskeletal protein CcmA (bactofilin family)
MPHLDEMTCLLYVEGQLDRTRAQEVSVHIDHCPACRVLLRALDRESRLLTRAMLEGEEELPARLAQFQQRARRSMQWIWIVVFGFAATGVYAVYAEYIQPWLQQLDQAGFGSSNILSLLIFQGAFWKGWQSMITLLEVLAMITLGALGAAIFRKRFRRSWASVVILGGLSLAFALPQAAFASEFRKGDTVEVRENETINGDVFLFGNRIRVEGTVNGDVYLFSADASVTGHVKGDVIAFAQGLRVSGDVDGNIRCFSNNITITGTVSRNVTSFNEILSLDSAGKVDGSLNGFGKTLSIDGHLGKDLMYYGEHAGISGTVGNGVRVTSDTFSITSTASIGGLVKYEGNNPPDVSSQARLAYGDHQVEFTKHVHNTERTPRHYVWQVIWAAAFVLYGLVLFLVLPSFSSEAVGNAHRYGAALGLGVLVGFALPIAAVLACITVVGLFIGLSTFFLWYAALYYGLIVVGGVVGEWLMGKTSELWPLIGRMVVGLIIVRLCTVIPYAGFWIKIAVALWGLGAIALTVYRRFQSSGATMSGSPVASVQPA